MIPGHITEAHIKEAIRCIIREGVPPRRRGRSYCLTTEGEHLPPKYTIARAHQVATGELLGSHQFSGGLESNAFLDRQGYTVAACNCGGSVRDGNTAPDSHASKGKMPTNSSRRHSQHCSECKIRVRQLLEHIYGECVCNHKFQWNTQLDAYVGTAIYSSLQEVAKALEENRGYGKDTFVRSNLLAPCDYWVPDPGFVVEFDESQHFTYSRKLALTAYADVHPLGFVAGRWIELCERHDARDNDPPYRDEQRAWYDTLRDLVPLINKHHPTVRLYARNRVWCSFDPDSRADQQSFLDLIGDHIVRPGTRRKPIGSSSPQPKSTLRVAMVFPPVEQAARNGVPPSGEEAQQPDMPKATDFAGEAIDFALFPEGYISASDRERSESLAKLAVTLRAPLLVGAIDRTVDATGRAGQVLLRFDPDGSRSRVYVKHSTAEAVAFAQKDWDPDVALPAFELCGTTVAATICHDQYLGLFPRALARRGARLWVNPSYDNVTAIKWSSILRLRAVENRFFSLCTLHYDVKRRKTHPFAFSPDGAELRARKAGSDTEITLSECCEAGSIYVVDLDMTKVGQPLDWSKVPPADKPRRPRNGKVLKPITVAVKDGQPAVLANSGWKTEDSGFRVETAHGSVYVGVVPNGSLLDPAMCFRVLDCARQMQCLPIIWNHWDQLPADSARLASVMMGRAIESCAPVVISDGERIHELVELANRLKIPTRREMESTGEAIIDLGYVWGLKSAFKMVTGRLPAKLRERALDRYRSLL